MIEVRGIAKRFGTVQALDGVSFKAKDGCITALLGPNGAGKSTLLRILWTILRPDAGTAQVGGMDVVAHPQAVRRGIGIMPHGANLYGNLTGRENVAYFASLHGLAGDALEGAVARALRLLDIERIADRRAKGFSQGERTRVALARALVHDPQTLILDEPTNGLDVGAIRALRDVVRERRDAGCCVLFSSHVMQEVAALCDTIVILASGAVAATGTADDIRGATGCDSLEEAFVQAVDGTRDELGGTA